MDQISKIPSCNQLNSFPVSVREVHQLFVLLLHPALPSPISSPSRIDLLEDQEPRIRRRSNPSQFMGTMDSQQTTGFIVKDVWRAYNQNVSNNLKIIDVFLTYVLAVGIVQFLYMLTVGSFPFNSFLSGFLSCVGVFVLTVSLRMQLNPVNIKDPANRWSNLTRRRAYLDWLFCNLILHMAVLNFLG